MSRKLALPSSCWCGQAQLPTHCCLPHIEGTSIPKTAEQLMRSRYSAYVLERSNYLQDTWHVSTRPPHGADYATPGIKWLGLIVHTHESTDNQASVRFTARCKISGRMTRMQELSHFVFENGRWWYLNGEIDG